MIELEESSGIAKAIGTGRAVVYHKVEGMVDTHTEVSEREGGRQEGCLHVHALFRLFCTLYNLYNHSVCTIAPFQHPLLDLTSSTMPFV